MDCVRVREEDSFGPRIMQVATTNIAMMEVAKRLITRRLKHIKDCHILIVARPEKLWELVEDKSLLKFCLWFRIEQTLLNLKRFSVGIHDVMRALRQLGGHDRCNVLGDVAKLCTYVKHASKPY